MEIGSWVLVIFLFAGNTEGGVAIEKIEGFTEASCKAAATSLLANKQGAREEYRPRNTLGVTCIKK